MRWKIPEQSLSQNELALWLHLTNMPGIGPVKGANLLQRYTVYELFPDILPTNFVNKIDYVIAIKMALRAYLLAFPVQVVDELTEHYERIENVRSEKLNKLKNS